jgi:hypothetical protein
VLFLLLKDKGVLRGKTRRDLKTCPKFHVRKVNLLTQDQTLLQIIWQQNPSLFLWDR